MANTVPQIADIAASAIGQAFERDVHGNVEDRYLREILPKIYCRGKNENRYSAYGLKMHPSNGACEHALMSTI